QKLQDSVFSDLIKECNIDRWGIQVFIEITAILGHQNKKQQEQLMQFSLMQKNRFLCCASQQPQTVSCNVLSISAATKLLVHCLNRLKEVLRSEHKVPIVSSTVLH